MEPRRDAGESERDAARERKPQVAKAVAGKAASKKQAAQERRVKRVLSLVDDMCEGKHGVLRAQVLDACAGPSEAILDLLQTAESRGFLACWDGEAGARVKVLPRGYNEIDPAHSAGKTSPPPRSCHLEAEACTKADSSETSKILARINFSVYGQERPLGNVGASVPLSKTPNLRRFLSNPEMGSRFTVGTPDLDFVLKSQAYQRRLEAESRVREAKILGIYVEPPKPAPIPKAQVVGRAPKEKLSTSAKQKVAKQDKAKRVTKKKSSQGTLETKAVVEIDQKDIKPSKTKSKNKSSATRRKDKVDVEKKSGSSDLNDLLDSHALCGAASTTGRKKWDDMTKKKQACDIEHKIKGDGLLHEASESQRTQDLEGSLAGQGSKGRERASDSIDTAFYSAVSQTSSQARPAASSIDSDAFFSVAGTASVSFEARSASKRKHRTQDSIGSGFISASEFSLENEQDGQEKE